MASDPLDQVLKLLKRNGPWKTKGHNFPPTEIYNEGWMLWLVLDTISRKRKPHPPAFQFEKGAEWFSEGQLASPFARVSRHGKHGESRTHADAIVGHFSIQDETRAGIELKKASTQFVVVEAKMASRLSPKTTHGAKYDQVARNIACMSWTLAQAKRAAGGMTSLGFFVFAPEDTLGKHESLLDKERIRKEILTRLRLFRKNLRALPKDPGMTKRIKDRLSLLAAWEQDALATKSKFFQQLVIKAISWEDLITALDPGGQGPLHTFYRRCKKANGLKP